MQTENTILMREARESLKGKWGLAVGTFFILLLISVALQMVPIIGAIGSLIITGPFSVGIALFSLSISRNEDPRMEQIFQGFNHFITAMVAYLLMVLFIFLWMLLLIIPGIIATLSYGMVFYILADDKNIGASDALKKSKYMMQGFKWKYFCLFLRFFAWSILCLFTFGIGYLWLLPYMQVSMAKFYEDVKSNYIVLVVE
jgi:uncharacterized membrane protein